MSRHRKSTAQPSMTAADILDALIARADDKICATELSFFYGKSRIDFWTLDCIPSKNFMTTAYEIKISRGDYKNDNEVKQSGALKYSDRFYYVTPPGLINVDELPEWAGLQEWAGKVFRTVKRAALRRKADPDWAFIVSLIRNCDECKRDYSMMKRQLAIAEYALKRYEKQDKLRRDMVFRRLMERSDDG